MAVSAIRFYEEKGLLQSVRTGGNQRRFLRSDIRRVSFVLIAQRLGLGLMVGNMCGTSLAMAPAVLLAEGAEFVDLDGPLLLAKDREGGLRFEGSLLHPPA